MFIPKNQFDNPRSHIKRNISIDEIISPLMPLLLIWGFALFSFGIILGVAGAYLLTELYGGRISIKSTMLILLAAIGLVAIPLWVYFAFRQRSHNAYLAKYGVNSASNKDNTQN